jgi:hypothetical protein
MEKYHYYPKRMAPTVRLLEDYGSHTKGSIGVLTAAPADGDFFVEVLFLDGRNNFFGVPTKKLEFAAIELSEEQNQVLCSSSWPADS